MLSFNEKRLGAKPIRMTGSADVINIKDLRRVYLFAFVVVALTHWMTILLIASTKLLESFSSFLGTEAASYRQVFLPPYFRSTGQIQDMVQGAHSFFQYDQYVSSSAAIVWAVTLHCNARGGWLSSIE